jgi:ferrochelatase
VKHRAVILVYLGSPIAPEPSAIRQFLNSFLSDPRVVEIPRWLWLPLLRAVILPLRSQRVAKLYRSIWTEQGSPLTAITQRQAERLEKSLNTSDVIVRAAAVYGTPSIAQCIDDLRKQGIEQFLVLPMYPQYSATTTAAVYDQVAALFTQQRYVPDIRIVREYCYRKDYIAALAQSIRQHRAKNGTADVLLFSFHGIPQACVDRGDPYYEQCKYTAEAVANALSLANEQWRIGFQSRFGRAKWLQPYTDEVLASLPASGVRRVDVVCPAFAADCLETLEEIEHGSRHCFMAAGGEYFSRIDCLNDSDEHIAVLHSIVVENGFGAAKK